MPIGTVKLFNDSKGYGFIQQDGGGSDAFVHVSAVQRAGMRGLRESQRLSFDLEQDNRGRASAVNLQSVESAQATQPIDQAEQSAQSTEAADQTQPAL